MAQLEILQCSGCGSPLSPGALLCEYCGNKNVIRSQRNPLKIDSAIAQKYISFYAQKTTDNPKDTNALYSMGLLYLNLKNYELAQRNFKDAIDQSPLDADMYYYYALSLIAGKCPKHLHSKEIVRIEQYINTAIGMEVKCKYLVLLAAVKEEYYIGNNLIVNDPSPRELFEQAKDYTPDDLEEIAEYIVILSEGVKYSTDLLLGKEPEEDDEDDEDDDERDDGSYEGPLSLTEGQRKQYYEFRLNPIKPGYNNHPDTGAQLLRKPAYPIVGRVWKLALSLLLSFIVLVVCLSAGWGFANSEGSTSEVNGIHVLSNEDPETNEIQSLYIKKDLSGVIWTLLILLPLILWIVTTIGKVKEVTRTRMFADAHNQHINQQYIEAIEFHKSRPTDAQMQAYTLNFLSIMVDTELGFHKIDESNLKGKTLFLNEYFIYKEDGEGYDNSAIEYKVVLLEDDCVTVISSDWRIYENISDTGITESISYADISNVRLSEDELSFGDMTIEIPDENVFEYQSDDAENDLTFSNNRISDVREFKIALEKLVRAYKNNRNL